MNPNFSNLKELKQRLMPALRNRKRELKTKNISITEDELWDYFAENYWKNAINLSLSRMVDDILNQDIDFNKNNIDVQNKG